MKLLRLFSVLLWILALEFSAASEVEALLRGANLTERQHSKEQIENIARLMRPKILKDQGIDSKKNYGYLLHRLKEKNQLFLVTHLLNAKDFLKFASLNKECFETIAGNFGRLKRHLSRDFIDDFPIYFTLPFPDDKLTVMEYFHMFCLHFGTEMSYSPQFVDQLQKRNVNGEMEILVNGDSYSERKLVNGEIFVSLHSLLRNFSNFKMSGNDPCVWEKNGKLFNYWNEAIDNIMRPPQIDNENKTYTPAHIESNEYRLCMCGTPANFRKRIRQLPPLNL
jgi:hypothetical protein